LFERLDTTRRPLGKRFYRSIGAIAMDEWTVQRLTGEPLRRMAGIANP